MDPNSRCTTEFHENRTVDAIIPDKVWDAIRPDGCEKGCGILCITCISRRIEEKGFKKVPVWLCGTEPLQVMPGDPGECPSVLINWEPIKRGWQK